MKPSMGIRFFFPLWMLALFGVSLWNLPYHIGQVIVVIFMISMIDSFLEWFAGGVYSDLRNELGQFLLRKWHAFRDLWGKNTRRSGPTTLKLPQDFPRPASPPAQPKAATNPNVVIPTSSVPEAAIMQGEIPERPVYANELPTVSMPAALLAGYQKVGEGGEAVVYRRPKSDEAIKVFRLPDCEFYAGDSPENKAAREGAATRLKAYPAKFRAFPLWLGSRVIAPKAVIQIDNRYQVGGYVMTFVDGAVQLVKYTDPDWKRQNNVRLEDIVKIFLDLYDTITEVHASGVIIGDFKPENVLVRKSDLAAFIVDAESAALGNAFPCRTFSENYVDPKLCDPTLEFQVLVNPYRRSSDWYAWTVMLFQALTNLNPWDGVYRPPKGKSPVLPTQRALKGISVYNQHVRVPEFNQTISHLPEELQAFFFRTFEAGLRERPSREMIQKLLSPAKRSKFDPMLHTCWKKFGVNINITASSQSLQLAPFYEGTGEILSAMTWRGKPLFVVKEGSEIKREDGTVVLEDTNHTFNFYQADPSALLAGKDNHNAPHAVYDGPFYRIAPEEQSVRIRMVDPTPDGTPNIGLQNGKLLWLEKGGLRIQDRQAPLVQFQDAATLFVGHSFSLAVILSHRSLTDLFFQKGQKVTRLISLPPIMGMVSNLQCVFSRTTAWLFITAEWEGVANRYVLVLDDQGNLISMAAVPYGQDLWFSQDSLKAAYERTNGGILTRGLLALTSKEFVRVECDGMKLAVRFSGPWTANGQVTHLLETQAGPLVGIRKPAVTPAAVQQAIPQAVANTVAQ